MGWHTTCTQFNMHDIRLFPLAQTIVHCNGIFCCADFPWLCVLCVYVLSTSSWPGDAQTHNTILSESRSVTLTANEESSLIINGFKIQMVRAVQFWHIKHKLCTTHDTYFTNARYKSANISKWTHLFVLTWQTGTRISRIHGRTTSTATMRQTFFFTPQRPISHPHS